MSHKIENPDVSFIIPIYKTPEDFLTKCVNSLCAQTHSNIEIILVDDGSPDGCPALCDAFAAQDTRIKVIHQKNLGVGAARNTGLDVAQGFWISFVDPDDWVDSDMIEKAIATANQYIEKNDKVPDVIIWDHIKEFGTISEHVNFFGNKPLFFVSKDELNTLHLLSLELTSGIGLVWAKLYCRDFLKNNKLYSAINLPRGQDIEYNFRIFQKVKSAIFIPEKTYHYRYDDNTACTAFNPNAVDYTERFLTALKNDIIELKCNSQFLHKFYTRSVHSILSIAVRDTFHQKNPASFKQKKQTFFDLCSHPIFTQAITNARYADFSIPRKFGLFCLKNHIIIGIWLIAKIRQMQYKVKQ